MKIGVYDTKEYDRLSLQSMGYTKLDREVEWFFHPFRLSRETAGSLEGMDAACVFVNDMLDEDCLQAIRTQGIKHIALRCAGFNNVDLVAAGKLGIRITRVPAYSPHAVAEHTLAILLTLNRKIHRAYNRVREQNFSLNGLVGFDLNQKTVAIVGTGKIGQITAQIFRGFNCRVLAYDIHPDLAWAQEHKIEYGDLNDVLATSDIISLHVPLNPETSYLINEKRLREMRHGAFLINTSRGKLIDTKALIQSLKSGHLGGVALDVYEEEEGIFFEDLSGTVIEDDELIRLLGFPNVLITAHQAFLTREALAEIAEVTCTNLQLIHQGKDPIEHTELCTSG